MVWGGTTKPHSDAQEDAWRKILAYLQHHLYSRSTPKAKMWMTTRAERGRVHKSLLENTFVWRWVLFITLNHASCLLLWPGNHSPSAITGDQYLRCTSRKRGGFWRSVEQGNIYWLVSWSEAGRAVLRQIKTTSGTVMRALTAALHLFRKEKFLNREP